MRTQLTIKFALTAAFCLIAFQVSAVNGPSCQKLFDSSKDFSQFDNQNAGASEGTLFARSVLDRLRDPNYKDWDQNTLRVIHFSNDKKLRGLTASGGGIADLISRSNRNELERIVLDRAYAESVVTEIIEQIKKDDSLQFRFLGYSRKAPTEVVRVEVLQRAARTFFAYEYINRTLPISPSHYSYRDFLQLAKIEGFHPSNFDLLYRFDSRAPEEVVAAKGFFPNPERARGSLADHSRPGVGSHGAGFVSLSVESGNNFNLNIGPVLYAARPFSTQLSTIESVFPDLQNKIEIKKTGGKVELLKTTEYEVASIVGIRPAAESAIAGEKEVVAPFVPLQNITRYRNIYILAETVRDDRGDLQNIRLISVKTNSWLPVD